MSKRKQAPAVPEETIQFETVTPDRASTWLDLSIDNNRPPRDTNVLKIANDIRNGLWIVTGQSIQFNVEGKLFDGRHRLMACVIAGESIRVPVARNLPMEAMQVVDQGTPRTMGDSLRWRNETDVNVLSSIIRLACIWERGLLNSYEWKWKLPSNQAALHWYDSRQQEIRDALVASRAVRKKPISLTPSVAGAFYWIAHPRFPLETDDFIKAVEIGANLDAGDPALAYRNWVLAQQWEPGQLDQRTKLAQILRAFGQRLEGQKVKGAMKTWQPDDKKPNEDFPELPDVRPARRPIPAQSEAVAAGSGQ